MLTSKSNTQGSSGKPGDLLRVTTAEVKKTPHILQNRVQLT